MGRLMPEHAATGETIFRGIPVSTGVCVGKILILGQQRAAISRQIGRAHV